MQSDTIRTNPSARTIAGSSLFNLHSFFHHSSSSDSGIRNTFNRATRKKLSCEDDDGVVSSASSLHHLHLKTCFDSTRQTNFDEHTDGIISSEFFHRHISSSYSDLLIPDTLHPQSDTTKNNSKRLRGQRRRDRVLHSFTSRHVLVIRLTRDIQPHKQ